MARNGEGLKMAKTVGSGGEISGSKYRPASEGEGEGEGERYVCLRVINCYTGFSDWYMIDVLNNTKMEKKLPGGKMSSGYSCVQNISPFASMEMEYFGHLTIYAYTGSIVYCIGGIMEKWPVKFSRDVYMVDKCRPDKGFSKLPSMINTRAYSGAALALDGKLYVFGGNLSKDEDPWAEYYDPEEKRSNWKPLPQPPTRLGGRMYAIAFEGNILVGSLSDSTMDTVLIYDLESDSWKYNEDGPIDLPACYKSPIMVDDTLYWLSGDLFAYDLKSKKSYSCTIKGSELEGVGESGHEARYCPPLIHLRGNEFCFFPLENICSTIHCTRFRVVKAKDGYMDAFVLFKQSFTAGQWLRVQDGTSVDIVGMEKQCEGSAYGESAKKSTLSLKTQTRSCASGAKRVSARNVIAVIGRLNIRNRW